MSLRAGAVRVIAVLTCQGKYGNFESFVYHDDRKPDRLSVDHAVARVLGQDTDVPLVRLTDQFKEDR